jgi:hypothetical protein
VLIIGGLSYFPDEFHSSAEVYDPVAGTFTYAGFMNLPRFFHTATRLSDGRVLVEHGYDDYGQPPPPSDIYDPVSGTFSPTGSPLTKRSVHTATLLGNGKVLVTGGADENGDALATTELFDPNSGAYAAGPLLSTARRHHTATQLVDGRVLLVGGSDGCPAECGGEVFDPLAQSFSTTWGMSIPRGAHSATLLNDGGVLVVGGQGSGIDTATAELYEPAANAFTAAGAMAASRWGHTATLLMDGTVLLVGGFGPFASNGVELYMPADIPPSSLVVSPATLTLQPAESGAFTVVDHLGHRRDDALWSVDAPSIVSIDADTGELLALDAGNATVTATVGTVTATAQVTVVASGPLPVGTIRWTAPTPAGLTWKAFVPVTGGGGEAASFIAVNAETGTTVTQLQALMPDGQQLWERWLPVSGDNFVPNQTGGLMFTISDGCDGVNPIELVNIDGATGMQTWRAIGGPGCTVDPPQIAVRHDGAVAIATPGNLAGFPNFMMLDGLTGVPLSVPEIPPSTFTSITGQQTAGYSRVGPTMVDVEGTVHLLFEKRIVAYPPQVVDTRMWLMSVRSNQTWTTTQITTPDADRNLFPGRIIPDGSGGLLVTWIDSPIVASGQPPAQNVLRAARVASGGGITVFDIPLTLPLDLLHPPDSSLPTNPEFVLGENGTAFVSYGASVASFNINTGASAWTYSGTSDVTLVAAARDGSLFTKTPAGDGTDTIMRFASGGGMSSSTLGLPTLGHVANELWASNQSNSSGMAIGELINWASTGWFQPSPGGQQRVKGLYRDRPGVPGLQDAAFEMMDALRKLATKWEYGGMICKRGEDYLWTRLETSEDAGFVDVIGLAGPDCANAGASIVADVHVHLPHGLGEPNPSTQDLINANTYTDWLFYLSVQSPNSKPPLYRYLRYKGPGASVANTCTWTNVRWVRHNGIEWVTCTAP